MKLKSILLLAATSALVICAASCNKDDDETETYMSFNGLPSFTLPPYVSYGDSFTIDPKAENVTRSSEDESTATLGCVWTISQMGIKDTVRREGDDPSIPFTYSFTVPDTLTSLNVICSIIADGYYNSASSQLCMIIRKTGSYQSLRGIERSDSVKKFTDTRDGTEYHYVTVAGLDWMVDNLQYRKAGKSYYNCDIMDSLFGKYYTWTEAVSSCPEGWTLPSNEEFLQFNNAFVNKEGGDSKAVFDKGAGCHMADAYLNGNKMWEYWPDVKITNKSDFSLLPLGYASIVENSSVFHDSMNFSMFWTRDEFDEEQAYYRSIYLKYDYIACEKGAKDYMAMPVRCVRRNN